MNEKFMRQYYGATGYVPPDDGNFLSSVVADNVIHRLRGCTLLKEDAMRVNEVLMQCVKPETEESN